MNRRVHYAIACGILCAAFIGWRVHVLANYSAPQDDIVLDRSFSHPGGCESLVGLAEQAAHADGISRNSTITVIVLGDATTANEPWQLGRYPIPVTRKVLEGKTSNQQRWKTLLTDIQHKCGAIRRTNSSPIFMGVKQAVADLHARGCKENSHCQVFVDTDLEENVETSIRESLNRTHKSRPSLPAPLDNNGIEVSFCGLAVTTGRITTLSEREARTILPRDPGRDDQLKEVWRSLLTHPEHVRFEPYCPMYRD
jgi:hypothetical protein